MNSSKDLDFVNSQAQKELSIGEVIHTGDDDDGDDDGDDDDVGSVDVTSPFTNSSKSQEVGDGHVTRSLPAGKSGEILNSESEALHLPRGQGVLGKGPPRWRSQRYILGYLLCWNMMNIFLQRVNLSIAIVCMVNHTALRLQAGHNQTDHSFTSSSSSSPASSLSFSSQDILLPNGNLSAFDGLRTHGQPVYVTSPTPGPFSASQDGHFPVNLSRGVAGGSNHGTGGSGAGAGVGRGGGRGGDGSDARSSNSDGVDGRCGGGDLSQEKAEDGPMVWDKTIQGQLLGAIYWTYLLVQVPGTMLVRNQKKTHVILVSMSVMTLMTLLTHVAALWSPWAVFVIKLVQGACTAFVVLAMYGMWAKWAPPSERASLLSLNISGQMIANVIVFPLSGLLCKYGFLGGWPSVFYVFGLLSVVGVVFLFIFMGESPSTHRFITEEEREYIISSLPFSQGEEKQVKVPWSAMLTSSAVWALVCAHCSFTWGLFLMLSTLPQYMHEVLKFDIKSNGFFSMLPYAAILVCTQASGNISDWVIKRKIMRLVWVRKSCVIVANMTPAVLLAILSFLDCSHSALAIVCLTFAIGISGFAVAGFFVYPFDIAPRFSTSLMSFSNSCATIPGILTPYVVAALTKDKTREQWQIVFFLTSAILAAGTLGFCLFGKGHVQPWALDTPQDLMTRVDTTDPDVSAAGITHTNDL